MIRRDLSCLVLSFSGFWIPDLTLLADYSIESASFKSLVFTYKPLAWPNTIRAFAVRRETRSPSHRTGRGWFTNLLR